MLFDALMLVIQIFPFMDLAAVRYLLTFAPIDYLGAIFFFYCMWLCSLMAGLVFNQTSDNTLSTVYGYLFTYTLLPINDFGFYLC